VDMVNWQDGKSLEDELVDDSEDRIIRGSLGGNGLFGVSKEGMIGKQSITGDGSVCEDEDICSNPATCLMGRGSCNGLVGQIDYILSDYMCSKGCIMQCALTANS
jgi:hypothetical protein